MKVTARRAAHIRAVLGIGVALLLWEMAAIALDGSYLLAGPIDVIQYATAHSGLLGRALIATSYSALLGYLWGNAAAVLLAACAIVLPPLERPIRFLSLVIFCLPLIATGPILRVLYGPGIGPQVTLSALGVFYTTLVPLLAGLRAAPKVWLDLIDSYGRGRWVALVEVRAVASAPYFVAGLQIAAPAAFLGAMIGEFTGAERGLGVLTIRAIRSLDVEATWSIAAIAAMASLTAYGVAGLVGRRLYPERPEVLLTPPPPQRQRNRLTEGAILLMLVCAVLLAWHGAMDAFDLNRFFAKRPIDVWRFLVSDTSAEQHRLTLWSAMLQTAMTAVPGYLVGLLAGVLLAVLAALLPGISSGVMTAGVILRAVPILTTAPLVVLWLGRGPTGVVAVVAIMIFFPTLVASVHGLRMAPAAVVDVFESYATGRLRTLVYARLPAALPSLFAAARMAVPAAFLAATVAEWLTTGQGLGNLMALSASTSDYNMLWSATAILTAVTVAFYVAVARVEYTVFRRYAPEQLNV